MTASVSPSASTAAPSISPKLAWDAVVLCSVALSFPINTFIPPTPTHPAYNAPTGPSNTKPANPPAIPPATAVNDTF